MNEHKGRALGYVLVALGSWILARMFVLNTVIGPDELVQLASKRRTDSPSQNSSKPSIQKSLEPFSPTHGNKSPLVVKVAVEPRSFLILMPQFRRDDQQATHRLLPIKTETKTPNINYGADAGALFAVLPPSVIPNEALRSSISPASPKPKPNRHARFYTYSFWRPDSGTKFVINPGQFAGSQSGFVGEIPLRLDRNNNSQLAFIFRGFAVPNEGSATEMGAGISVRPLSMLPVSVAIEARLRANNSRKLVAYFVIAPKPLKLSPKLSLNTYAQLGAFNGKDSVQFLDANARLDLTLLSRPKTKIVIGPILAANIQNGKHRVEFGPSISADIGLGKTNFRIAADYRLQAAGDEARPSGPTLTASTSF